MEPELKYSRILAAVSEEVWAVLPSKLEAIRHFLLLKSRGEEVDPESAGVLVVRAGPREVQRVGTAAVIPIFGTISHRAGVLGASSLGTSSERISAQLRQAMGDDQVRSIVLDINSPGGAATGIPELADEIRAAREEKRIVAFVNPLAASAAYWLASQATEVVVTPSGSVGSIGVISAHEDLSKAMELEGRKVTVLSSGKFKAEGNPFEPLSDEAKAHLQERLDTIHETFVAGVAKGRGVPPSKVRSDFGQGRVYLAQHALARGMVDRVGTLDSVLGRLTRGKNTPTMRAESKAVTELATALNLRTLTRDLKAARPKE